MRISLSRLALPAAALAFIGCAVTAGGGLSGFQEQLGPATPGDLANKTRFIFSRYQYEMERQDSSNTYQLYESRWQLRPPFQDELDSGVTSVRTRLIVRGRARGTGGMGASDTRQAELAVENMVRRGDEADWEYGMVTPMFRDWANEIAVALKEELMRGIRVF